MSRPSGPRTISLLKIFVASPGDVSEERAVLEEVVRELNLTLPRNLGVMLELVRWETHAMPGMEADVQDVINRQIGVEGTVVRRPRARPPRAPVTVCPHGAPRASRAADCLAGFFDPLESQPHHRSDPHSGLGLAQPRLDRRHRRDAPVAKAGSDPARPALLPRGLPAASPPHR